MRLSVAAALAFGIASVATAVGCTHNPFRTAASSGPISLTPPPGVAAPANTLPQPVTSLMPSFSQSNLDSGQLEANLVRSRQETQLMQDEITALRDQLASTSSQLAQNRTANMPSGSTAGRGPIAGGKGVPPTQPLGMQRHSYRSRALSRGSTARWCEWRSSRSDSLKPAEPVCCLEVRPFLPKFQRNWNGFTQDTSSVSKDIQTPNPSKMLRGDRRIS